MKQPLTKFIEIRLGTRFLLISCGLPGTGKTVTSEMISRATGCPLLRTDLVRLEVLAGEDVFDEKVAASTAQRERVYDEMFRRADRLANKDGVILDGTFFTRALRGRAAAIAARHDLRLVIVETRCPRQLAISRILARTREDYTSNALTEAAYLSNERDFEPVDLDELRRRFPGLETVHVVVDTSAASSGDWSVVSLEERAGAKR